jgi:hypothetical protein
MATTLSGCENVPVSEADQTIARMRAERPILLEFVGNVKKPEPTLDQARSEFADSVSQIFHTLFSNKYGPMVGSVTKTTVETLLINAEKNAAQTKHDAKLFADELFQRIFKQEKKK